MSGARGPLSKPQARRRQRVGKALEPAPTAGAALPVPVPPSELSERARQAWALLWGECGSWLAPADAEPARRWCELVSEREELVSAVGAAGRVARGSQGQPVTHPLVEQLRAVEAALGRLEAVLGVGPANRARLGLSLVRIQKDSSAVEEVMARYRRAAGQKGTKP